MPIPGVDYSWARPDPACLYKSGFRFAVRYVSYSTTGKSMSAAEVKELHAAGLSVVTVWQQGAQDALGGFDRGSQYARDADRMHRAAGGPSSAPIYFAVDFDASTAQLPACFQYLRGAASVLGWGRVGVYGSVRVIRYMAERGVRWLWQTYAWSGGQWDPRAQLRQWRNGVTRCGGTVDLTDATTDDYGQWPQAKEWWEMAIPKAELDKIAKAVWEHQQKNNITGEPADAGTLLRYAHSHSYNAAQALPALLDDEAKLSALIREVDGETDPAVIEAAFYNALKRVLREGATEEEGEPAS